MNIRLLGIVLLFSSTLSFSNGRSPAVEDFVGIEVDHAKSTPQGSESLYNLEHDMNKMDQAQRTNNQTLVSISNSQTDSGMRNVYFVVVAILGMPMISYFMILNHLRKKATVESVSNIEVLEKFRKEKELAKSNKENLKKVA